MNLKQRPVKHYSKIINRKRQSNNALAEEFVQEQLTNENKKKRRNAISFDQSDISHSSRNLS